MYIASYQGIDSRSLYQVLVHFPKLVLQAEEPVWSVAYRRLIDNLTETNVDFAYRIGCFGGRINRCLLITSFDRLTASRLAIAAVRLNDLVSESAVTPNNQAEHDRNARYFPPIRRTICRTPYFARNIEIPCDFFVYPLTSRLLRLALSSRSDFALQINCRRHTISQEEVRTIRKRLVDLRFSGSMPAPVIAHVSKQVDDLAGRTFLVDECIGASSQGMLNSVGGLIDTTFRQRHAPLGFSDSSLGEPPSEDEIIMGLHHSYFEESMLVRNIWRGARLAAIGDFIGWVPEEIFASSGVVNLIREAPTRVLKPGNDAAASSATVNNFFGGNVSNFNFNAPINNAAIGDHATFMQNLQNISVDRLASDLEKVRTIAAQRASTDAEKADAKNLDAAAEEAGRGNKEKSVNFLRQVGTWGWSVVKELASSMAADSLKALVGLS